MKLQQILKNCLLRWKEISGLDFCLVDGKDRVFVTTTSRALPSEKRMEEFRGGNALVLSSRTCSFYKILDGEELLYLLLVWGNAEEASCIGELAVCQVETLIQAHSQKNDKGRILQDILSGRYTETEIYAQAKKLRLSSAASRTIFLTEVPSPGNDSVLPTVRNIFGLRTRDVILPQSDTRIVILHEWKEDESEEEQRDLAALLVDMLNTEAMTKAKVSYSNVSRDIARLPESFREAETAMEIGRIFNADSDIYGYSHLGIGRLIYQLPPEICEMFLQEVIQEGSLDELDEETLNIIRTFFENNLNLSETARKLYVHRNTLVYRFDKLQKKYGLDIRAFEDALTFKLCMLVTNYIKFQK